MRETTNKHPSRLEVEQLTFGEGSDDTKKHVEICALCQELTKEIKNDQKAFLVKHPFDSFYNKLEKRLPQKRKKSLFEFFPKLIPLGVMALLAFFIVKIYEPQPESVRFKGNIVEMGFYVKAPHGARMGQKVEPLGAEDQIRLFVKSQKFPYVAVFGIEESGNITTYYPDSGSQSILIPLKTVHFFADSIILDDSSANELFLAVFGEESFSVELIKNRLLEEWKIFKKEGKSLKEWDEGILEFPTSHFYVEKK